MRATSQLDVVHCGLSSCAVGQNVMEFQEGPLHAAATFTADEGTPPAVAEPDRSLHLGRDVSRAGGYGLALARSVHGREFLPGGALQECGPGLIKDFAQIPVRNLVAQQVLRELELLVCLGPRRKLHLVALRRERGDDRRTWRGRRWGVASVSVRAVVDVRVGREPGSRRMVEGTGG